MSDYKNSSEYRVARYLTQEGFEFDYEPFTEGKKPDFLVSTGRGSVLIEVEEVSKLQIDGVRGLKRGFGFDPKIDWKMLRNNAIKHASKQLEPYAKTHDFRVILIGKSEGFEVKLNHLFNALVGDERLVMDFDTQTGIASNARWDPAVNGALRKNNKHGEMEFHKTYINAVGLIKEFYGRSWYEQEIWNRLKINHNHIGKNLDEIAKQGEKVMQAVDKYLQESGIPEEFSDPNRQFYRIELIINPLADRIMPKDLFNGRWDEIITLEIIYT